MTATDRETSVGLTLGKRRALQALSTREHVFAILAVDHIGSLASVVCPKDPASVTSEELVSIKVQLVEAMACDASGVLIDPILGLGPILSHDSLSGSTGLLLGLEDGDYATLNQSPKLFDGWDVARAARSGATGIKCSFFYDPFEPSPTALGFVSDLVSGCNRHGLPLFAEPLAMHPLSRDKREVVVETARQIGALGVDILKLEFPMDDVGAHDEEQLRDACLEVTSAASLPWTLLSGGEDFDTYSRLLTVACQAGASGYVAGRAVWKNLVVGGSIDTGEPMQEAQRRLRHLTQIATSQATPWTHRFAAGANSLESGLEAEDASQ